MTLTAHGVRCAFLVALGMAATTVSSGTNDAVSAAESEFLNSFGLLDSDSGSMVQPISFLSDDESDDESADQDDDESEDKKDSLEDRFAALEKQFEGLKESVDEVAEIAGDPMIVKSGSSKSTMVVSGRVHVDAWGFDIPQDDKAAIAAMEGGDPQNRIGFRRVRFGVKGKVKDNMLYKVEMEFAGGERNRISRRLLGLVRPADFA